MGRCQLATNAFFPNSLPCAILALLLACLCRRTQQLSIWFVVERASNEDGHREDVRERNGVFLAGSQSRACENCRVFYN
jgi:hypothetical protein